MTKISSSLPDREDDGLQNIHRTLIDMPMIPRVIVAVIDNMETRTNHSKGTVEPIVEFLHIEVADNPELEDMLRGLMAGMQERRTGRRPMFDPNGQAPTDTDDADVDQEDDGPKALEAHILDYDTGEVTING